MEEDEKPGNIKINSLLLLFLKSFKGILFLPLFIILVSVVTNLHAQQRYWVFFKDKNGVVFEPRDYFDYRTITRKKRLGISVVDSTDFPLREDYMDQVREIAGNFHVISRWFNAVSVDVNKNQLNSLLELECVSRVQPVKEISITPSAWSDGNMDDDYKSLLKSQLESMGGGLFAEKGLAGRNIRVAIFDGGFKNTDKLPAFDHLWENDQIVATYDFVRDKEDVFHAMDHGTKVLACIAGKSGDGNMGLATGAEFLLARTEIWGEKFSEEENWLRAMEWAYKNGADIINSSLGYTYQRYFPGDMDGTRSLVARAATMAARKGILVINSMGNDGDKTWEFVSTPADADSVLAVGAIDPYKGYHASFSSYGPTSDMRMKPNVAAHGKVIAASSGGPRKVYGTSFAAPLITGFAACIWEMKNHLPAMQLFKEIEKSGHLYPYFDYAHGYGIPQAGYFINKRSQVDSTFSLKVSNDTLFVELFDVEGNNRTEHLYYHVENPKGFLKYYAVIDVKQKIPLKLPMSELDPGHVVRVHYKRFTCNFLRHE